MASGPIAGDPAQEDALTANTSEDSSLDTGDDLVELLAESEGVEPGSEPDVDVLPSEEEVSASEVAAALMGPALPEFAPVLLPPSPDLVADLLADSSADLSAGLSGAAAEGGAELASPDMAASIAVAGAESTVATEFEAAGVARTVPQDEIEVEVVGSVAEEAPTRRRRRVLERIEDERYWRFKSVPSRKFDAEHMIFTPNVGRVRVVLNGGEAFDGRLHSVGQGKIMLDTKLGRMAVDARRADRVDRLTDDRSDLRDPSSSTSTVGLKRVKVKTAGGVFYGHLVSRRGDRVTLLMDGGSRITLESNDVTEAADGRGGRLRRVGPR